MMTLKSMAPSRKATVLLTVLVPGAGWAGAVDSGMADVEDQADSPAVSEPAVTRAYSLGLGVGAVPDYLGSQTYKAVFIPYFRAAFGANRYVRLRGATVDANLLGDGAWFVGPVVQFRPDPFTNAKNNHVDQLNGPGSALNVGGFIRARFGPWDLGLQGVGDVNGNQGALGTLGGGYTLAVDPAVTLRLGLATSYGGEAYMNAYFGVSAANARRSGLKRYDAEAGFRDVDLNARLTYAWTPAWTLAAQAAYLRLVGEAADSPLTEDDVGSKNQFFSAVSAIYHF